MKWEFSKILKTLATAEVRAKRMIVGRVGAVTFLRDRLNKRMFPRRRIFAVIKNEAKKTTKDRHQFISKLPQKSGRNAIRA